MINEAIERISQDTEIKDKDRERKEKGKETEIGNGRLKNVV